MTIKVSAICSAEETVAALNAPNVWGADLALSVHLGTAQILAGVLRKDRPDVVVLDFPVVDEADLEKIEAALNSEPTVHMALVSPDRSVEFLMRAMRAGVREVLPAPMGPMTVLQATKHVRGHQPAGGQGRHAAGHVIAMIPAKGGAGATFLGANLAFALAGMGQRVAVLDLNLYLGDAALFLGAGNSKSSMVDLARQGARLDQTLLDSSMVKVNEYLHVLAAPESPEHVNEIPVEAVENIVELARDRYDFVILDLPALLDPVSIKALDLAETIYLTLQLNLPFLRAAKLMMAVFRALGYAGDKVQVVVNRHEKGGDISTKDVEKAISQQEPRLIPNSHAAAESSVNQGIPMLKLAPRDPVSHALMAWANELVPGSTAEDKGWLKGWFNFSS